MLKFGRTIIGSKSKLFLLIFAFTIIQTQNKCTHDSVSWDFEIGLEILISVNQFKDGQWNNTNI